MGIDEIRRRANPSGFVPFTILTSGGQHFPVPHPEFIFITRRFVIVADA
ncbi:MAG: hypothetical protein KIT22_08195 [Verrucomicrobiae bacterium]|nr:hypothetical protein [Verrucomicrobiae bacterium]